MFYLEAQTSNAPTWVIFIIPSGKYNGISLASAIQYSLITRFTSDTCQCIYQASRGKLQINANLPFRLLPDTFADMVMSTSLLTWTDVVGNPASIDYDNLQFINYVLRHTLRLGFSYSFTR